MTSDKQIQKAGENSQQIQAGTINNTIYYGIDEKRAREIFNEEFVEVVKTHSKEAYEEAGKRVSKLGEVLIPRICRIEGALEKFADPSFQRLILIAQMTAISAERDADFDILSDLVIKRIQEGDKNRKVHAWINRAVEIVDQIDDDALCALTVAYLFLELFPMERTVKEALDTFENLFSTIIYTQLPKGTEWLDHLEILDAIRFDPVNNFKKFEEFYPKTLNGYVCIGIAKNTDKYNKAIALLETNQLPLTLLIDNELLDGYVRLPIAIKSEYYLQHLISERVENGQHKNVTSEISRAQIHALRCILNLYEDNEELKKEVIKRFIDECKKRKTLSYFGEWWDSISTTFEITGVGKVLAHAYARTCDERIPK